MATICPSITARNPHTYRTQMERVAHVAQRIHIDLMDGAFAPHKSIEISDIWWPVGMKADIHLMYKRPLEVVGDLIALKPSLVIVHAEAEGNFYEVAEMLKSHNIKIGVALLQRTAVDEIEPVVGVLDHVLIFSGDLGRFGGRADSGLLDKVRAVKAKNPNIEVGWDGGVDDNNAQNLIEAGVDVLDVGGFIQHAEDPRAAYAKLKSITGNKDV